MRGNAGPGRLRHRVLANISEHELWRPGAKVAVAVSGGMDSVALLDLLLQTQGAHGGVMSVATVDHGTREDSSLDADFVEQLALRAKLPYHRATLRLGSSASEEKCRDARYAFFDDIEVDAVVVAHHRDDQAETVLLQLLRGTGTRGLGGMGWKRGRIVRPLLDVTREELRAWADHRALVWREDSSNLDPSYLRNRVRHEVIPLLEKLRPGASATLARSAGVCADDDAWLEQLADAALEGVSGPPFPAPWVASAPPALVGRVIQRISPDLGANGLRALRAAAVRQSGEVALEGGRAWRVADGMVTLHDG